MIKLWVNMKTIFCKEYHGFEDCVDIGRDISEMFDPRYNPDCEGLGPEFQGTVKVEVTYLEPNASRDEPISTRPYREDYAAVVVYVDGGTSACTIDGRLNVGGIQRFIYKPKKVAYVKPLHVILTENRYEVDCYGITIYEDSEGMKLAFPALYTRFFGEPVEDFYRKTPGSYTLNNNFFGIPESWIEYKEEE